MEDALYETESQRRFNGIELGQDAVLNESIILGFRHLLEKHNLAAKLFEANCGYLEENSLFLREGHHCRYFTHHFTHRCSQFHQKQREKVRPGDDIDQDGQPVVLQHEGSHGNGYKKSYRAQPSGQHHFGA